MNLEKMLNDNVCHIEERIKRRLPMYPNQKFMKITLFFFVFFVLTAFTIPTTLFAGPPAKCPCFSASEVDGFVRKAFGLVRCTREGAYAIIQGAASKGITVVYGADAELGQCWRETENENVCGGGVERHDVYLPPVACPDEGAIADCLAIIVEACVGLSK